MVRQGNIWSRVLLESRGTQPARVELADLQRELSCLWVYSYCFCCC